MFSKKNLINYIYLFSTIVFSFGVILIFNEPVLHIVAFWLVVFVSICIAKVEITHPLVWFSGSFALYSTSHALLYILDYPSIQGYSKENILIPFIGLVIVVIIIGVKQYPSPNFHTLEKLTILKEKNNKKLLEFILVILILVLFVSVISISITPFNHKNDLLSNNNIFFTLGMYSTRFISFFCCFYILLFIDLDRKKTKFFIITSAVLIIALSLFTGERDAMLRYLVIIFMTLFFLKKINRKFIIILIPVGMIFLTLSVYLKYFFVQGVVNERVEESSFVYNFLTADFNAAGENLQVLLNNSWTESLYDFSLIGIDIVSPFFPSGVFFNVGLWFNNTFYPNSYSRAFTLVGEGYVIAGILGVMIIFVILSFLLKLLYSNHNRSIYWLVVYIYAIPTVILSFRSTLGTVFNDLSRIALFSLVIHAVLLMIINNKKLEKK